MTFVDRVRAQPWYPQVKQIFAAAGVPEYLWIAVLANECSSLACTSNADSGGISYGLFQLRQPGIGSQYSPSTLEDPVQNATIAAGVMGQALKNVTTRDPLALLRAIEEAGWPGNDIAAGANSVLLNEEPKRIGLLYETLKAMGLNALANDVLAHEAQPGVNSGDYQQAGGCNGPSWWPCLPVFINGALREFAILAIATALFAGGIALMAGKGN